LLVCFAVREEARYFHPPEQPTTEILVTGMGTQCATNAVQSHLAARCPRLVITCGFAGGLDPAHPLGQVLADCSQAGPFREPVRRAHLPEGRFAHSDQVLISAAEKGRLRQTTGADAVEMESTAIVSLCRERNIPALMLRVISDTARENLPLDFNQFRRVDGDLSLPRLLLGLAGSPSAVPRLIAFQRHLRIAARCLAEALDRLLRVDGGL
jgi:adenosylhomocysteine nucleosidase